MYVLIENSHGTVMCCSLKAVTKPKKKKKIQKYQNLSIPNYKKY